MYLKKCLALLVSAALAVSLLASCGSKALSSVMADLLTGLYDNVSVEVDNDLTAALKKAVSAGGTQEEILTALIENLNLSSVSIAFSSLGSGQQGDHGVTLTFQTGNDPDAAARIALAQWASIFGSLPANGSYSASVAMIEADNGYYIAVDVEVTKAGSSGKDDDQPVEDKTDGIKDDGAYHVYTVGGLIEWADKVQSDRSLNCTLEADITLTATDNWTPIGTSSSNAYTGTFDGDGHSITGLTVSSGGTCVGLIGCLGSGGKVQNLTLENVNLTGSYYVGGVVGLNQDGTVTGCYSTGSVEGDGNVGGVVGRNYGGTVTGCYSTGSVSGSDSVGGVVGYNESGTVTGCYSTGSVEGDGNVGGVVGYNWYTVTACYSTGDVTATGTNGYAGGVVGYNWYTVTACYWSGMVTVDSQSKPDQGIGEPDQGIGEPDQGIGGDPNSSGDTTWVDGTDVTWVKAVDAMNTAIQTWNAENPDKTCDWRYELGDEGLPVLTQ